MSPSKCPSIAFRSARRSGGKPVCSRVSPQAWSTSSREMMAGAGDDGAGVTHRKVLQLNMFLLLYSRNFFGGQDVSHRHLTTLCEKKAAVDKGLTLTPTSPLLQSILTETPSLFTSITKIIRYLCLKPTTTLPCLSLQCAL